MSKYSASIFNYLFNSINSIVVIINGIIMVPIYFKFMSVSTYGAWLATGNIVAMLGLLESGFSGVITQKMSVAIANKNQTKFLELAGANIITALFIAAMLFLSGLCIAPFIAKWINAENSIQYSITIAYIISLASAALAILVSLLGAFPQVWQDTRKVGIINTGVNIVGIAMMVGALLLGAGVIALAIGYISRSLLNLVFQGKWIINKWKKLQLSKPIYKFNVIQSVLKDCFYPFLSRLSNVGMNNSQSFIISVFMSPASAAIYDITSKVCTVACGFVSSANGSFFALFSLTFASKNKIEIDMVLKHITSFFIICLCSVVLYSVCFSQSVVYFWVGLNKYGGNLLLVAICVAILINQLKNYFNNLLYTGGLINKSSKLDILSLVVYIFILLVSIKYIQEYAIPTATIISSGLFLYFYVRLLKTDLAINIKPLLIILLKSVSLIIPFILIHYLLKINLFNLWSLVLYGLAFSVLYFLLTACFNKDFVKTIYSKHLYAKQ